MAEFPVMGNGGTTSGVNLARRQEGYSLSPNPTANLVGRKEERSDRKAVPPVFFVLREQIAGVKDTVSWLNAVAQCVVVLFVIKHLSEGASPIAANRVLIVPGVAVGVCHCI